MGKWHTYHLTLDPGERDPEQVAAELRSALPAVLDGVTGDHIPLDDVVHEEVPDVWIEDGRVHYATGRNWRIMTFDWSDLVPSLPVAARWACAVWQQEVEYNGGVEVFGWVDGGFVRIDEEFGRFGTGGADALAYAEREWGVEGSMERDVDPEHRADPDDPVAEPDVAPGFEPVDRDALSDAETALDVLDDPDPGRRRTAAERLYVLVAERDQSPGVDPRLFDALDDEATRWAASATIRTLSPSADDLRGALTGDDPARRRAAARYCLLADLEDVPVDPLRKRLADPDAGVRAVAARAFERSAIGENADPPAGAFEDLLAATEDPDPAVRGAATVAVVRFAFDQGAGDPERAADAFARVAFDGEAAVRERLAGYAGTNDLAHYLPDDVVARLLVAFPEADAGTDVEAPGFVEDLVEYPAWWSPDLVEPALPDLVSLGWDRGSTVARGIVGTYADRADEDGHGYRREEVRAALDDAGVDPDEML